MSDSLIDPRQDYEDEAFDNDEANELPSGENQRGEQYTQDQNQKHKIQSPLHIQEHYNTDQYESQPRADYNRPQTQQQNARLPHGVKHSNYTVKDSSPFRSTGQISDSSHFQQQRLHTSNGKIGHNAHLQNSATEMSAFRGPNNRSHNQIHYTQPNGNFQQVSTMYNQRTAAVEKPPMMYYSQEKDRGRRQFIAQMLNLQNQSQSDSVYQANNPSQKRKKIKDFIYGSVIKGSNQGFQQVEREELQQERRTLKIQMNVVKDENIRLKTKLQQLQTEIAKKEKDIESLTHKLQHQATHQQSTYVTKDTNVYESFLVSQLKKQNREMRLEIGEKEKTIEGFKKDIKLTKITEVETELNFYMEECNRLRNMLEAALIENQQRAQMQMNVNLQDQQSIIEQTRIEEAFYEKEVELQREKEGRTNLQMQVLADKDQLQRMQEKMAANEQKMKKFNDVINENKRKQRIITEKLGENAKLREEVEELRKKAQERDQVYNKNKDLVTKSYAQQSAIDTRDKRIKELEHKQEELLEQIRALQKQQKTIQASPERTKVVLPQPVTQQLMYGQHMQVLMFRAIRGQPLSNPKDTVPLKNYYSSNKSDLEKEIDYVKKLNKRDELFSYLSTPQRLNLLQSHSPVSYQLLEKFIDDSLQLKDQKDLKKYLITHWVFKHSDDINALNFKKLLGELQHTKTQTTSPEVIGQSQQAELAEGEPIVTVRVNESIGEVTAQFIPPSNFSQTPINQDEQSTAKKSMKQEVLSATGQDEYEGDEFERVTEHDKSEVLRDSQQMQQTQKFDNVSNQSTNNQPTNNNQQEEDLRAEDQITQQITEDQMLDIAEHVFQLIADRIKTLKLTVRKAFGKNCQILDEFEGDYNLEIVQARDFLEGLRQIGVNGLSELEVACLMRVLSKPEIDHAIVLSELQMVMENFGLREEAEEKPTAEDISRKKQKQNKKKLLKELINMEESEVYEHVLQLVKATQYNVEGIRDLVQSHSYEQLVKSKKKEMKVILIKREDFVQGVKETFGFELDLEVLAQVSPLLQIDAKYSDVYQSKQVLLLFEEVLIRHEQEEVEQKALEEFYKPNYEDEAQEGSNTANINGGGEVMNFDALINEDENEYYIGDDSDRDNTDSRGAGLLNPISEDAQEESVSPHPKERK